jgi:hypothetical protein
MIEVERLSKRFGPVTAVDDLSFTVRPGRVTGFLGPNGAGKTTTMRIILGLVLISLRGTPCRRENGCGLPADAGVFSGTSSPWASLAPGPDLEGSRTVASSTPVRISVPDRGPRAARYLSPVR